MLNQIREFSISRPGNYRSLVRKQMPNAQGVADRFPVAQLVNRELNTVCNQEFKLNRTHIDELKQTQIQKVSSIAGESSGISWGKANVRVY